jgi:hypothetical protein
MNGPKQSHSFLSSCQIPSESTGLGGPGHDWAHSFASNTQCFGASDFRVNVPSFERPPSPAPTQILSLDDGDLVQPYLLIQTGFVVASSPDYCI